MNVYCIFWDASQATVMANHVNDVPKILNEHLNRRFKGVREDHFYIKNGTIYYKWNEDDSSVCEVEKVLDTPQVVQYVTH